MYGQRRAVKAYAANIRRKVRQERRLRKARNIGVMHESSQSMLRSIRANHVNPMSVDHLTEAMDALGAQASKKDDAS